MRKLKIILFILSILFYSNLSQANIEIKYKIGENIITNIDILNEQNYLIFLRPDINKLSKKEIEKISENSLIREIIKKEELKKIYKDIGKIKLDEKLKKNLLNFKNVKNENELRNLIKKNNLKYNKIMEKMKYESLWNDFIFRTYNSMVRIDKEKLKNELKLKISKNKKYEYLLYEILFEVQNNETLDNKYKEILEYIDKNNFNDAAAKYSISNSSIRGGEIGWVKETLLSKKLNSILKVKNKGEFTKPIKYPNGYLILKINQKKEMKQILSFDNELKELINFERNKQLNQFSLLFFKKIKQNTVINEY